jgi:hypothetical protein
VHVACAIRDHRVSPRELHFGETDRGQIRWDSIRALLDLGRQQMVAKVAVITDGTS